MQLIISHTLFHFETHLSSQTSTHHDSALHVPGCSDADGTQDWMLA
jgi:hypothetical protein